MKQRNDGDSFQYRFRIIMATVDGAWEVGLNIYIVYGSESN